MDLLGNSGNRFTKNNSQLKHSVLISWFVLCSCVVIFPIQCHFSERVFTRFLLKIPASTVELRQLEL